MTVGETRGQLQAGVGELQKGGTSVAMAQDCLDKVNEGVLVDKITELRGMLEVMGVHLTGMDEATKASVGPYSNGRRIMQGALVGANEKDNDVAAIIGGTEVLSSSANNAQMISGLAMASFSRLHGFLNAAAKEAATLQTRVGDMRNDTKGLQARQASTVTAAERYMDRL